jgi:cyclase
MLKKRIIFVLYYCDSYFIQSRNFFRQKVGTIEWLKKNYDIINFTNYLDELIILDISNNKKNNFLNDIRGILANTFIPVSLGGKISDIKKVKEYIKNGADKVIINSYVFCDDNIINLISKEIGKQSLIVSIDVKRNNKKKIYEIYSNGGKNLEKLSLGDYLIKLKKLNIGEIFLNSIDRDGTGFGYDEHLIYFCKNYIDVPLIIAGGASKPLHLKEGLKFKNVDAVATSDIFNFLNDGFLNTRLHLQSKCNLPNWDLNIIKEIKKN